jgi:hypothetical protein
MYKNILVAARTTEAVVAMEILVNSNDVQKHFSCREDNRRCCCKCSVQKQKQKQEVSSTTGSEQPRTSYVSVTEDTYIHEVLKQVRTQRCSSGNAEFRKRAECI